jgi:hypothetical protein
MLAPRVGRGNEMGNAMNIIKAEKLANNMASNPRLSLCQSETDAPTRIGKT